jgi:hypothetical protein
MGPVQWDEVYGALVRSPPRTVLRFPTAALPALPSSAWRFPADALCRGMHARAEGGYWAVHLDEVHPSCSVVGHLRKDAPNVLYAGGTCVGGLVGYAAGGILGAVVGAGLGFKLAAIATVRR